MANDPKAEQGDQHENTDQEQRHWNRIAVSRRGCERERLGIDRWISEIHHKQAEGSEDEKGDHGPLQAYSRRMTSRFLHSCVVSFPGCKPSNSREVRTSGSSSQRWAITSSPSNWSVSSPKSRPAIARAVRDTSRLCTCPAPRCVRKECSATVKVGTSTCWQYNARNSSLTSISGRTAWKTSALGHNRAMRWRRYVVKKARRSCSRSGVSCCSRSVDSLRRWRIPNNTSVLLAK